MNDPNPFYVNNTHPEDDSVVSNDFSTALAALILGLVFLLGVPGNLFVIWSILARVRRRSITTVLILNLACADAFLMPLTILFIVYLAKQSWVFGDAMCKGLFYYCHVNRYASIFLITLMSLHRLVAVLRQQRAVTVLSSRRRVVVRLTCALWVLAMFTSVPALLFRDVREDLDERNKTRLVCAYSHTHPRQVVFQFVSETVMGFILPYMAIVTSYILIVRRLRQLDGDKLILGIVVTFGLFWLPYHVINMVQVAAERFEEDSAVREKLDHIWRSGRAVTSALALFSSCVNPVLYALCGRSYMRKNGLEFMARLFEGTSMEGPDELPPPPGAECTVTLSNGTVTVQS